MSEKPKSVQLEGKERDDLRERNAVILENLEAIARIVLGKVGYEPTPLGPGGLFKVVIMPHNSKHIYYDQKTGRCAAVYEDPPGQCRSCNDPYSTDGHAE